MLIEHGNVNEPLDEPGVGTVGPGKGQFVEEPRQPVLEGEFAGLRHGECSSKAWTRRNRRSQGRGWVPLEATASSL